MVKVFVDNCEVDVPEGSTLLDAACSLGIDVPTLCFLEGHRPHTSCMVCLVKVENPNRLVPACGTPAQEGMVVESETEEVHQARKAALELLLSEHAGECLAPCRILCPAGMDIPLMVRQIADGDFEEAIRTVRADIALPAVLGRICSAPCEKGCRRSAHDDAVSICHLQRYVADLDMDLQEPYMPPRKPDRPERVAIVGAGPTGLSAAYHLRLEGYACTVFDENDEPGGTLRYAVPEQDLPRDVLRREVKSIEKLGVQFRLGTRIGENPSLADLCNDFDAVLLAIGKIQPGAAPWLSHITGPTGVAADKKTLVTSQRGVFAAGSALRPEKLAIRALAQGTRAAHSIAQYLSGDSVIGLSREFTARMGRLVEGEMEAFLALASPAERIKDCAESGLQTDDARSEAERCLECSCGSAHNCKLRQYAQAYGARPSQFKGQRRTSAPSHDHPDVIYDPGKCILCGHCVHIAADAGEDVGLAFLGRGFDVTVAPPLGRSLHEGLTHAASECAMACPTGALLLKNNAHTLPQGHSEHSQCTNISTQGQEPAPHES